VRLNDHALNFNSKEAIIDGILDFSNEVIIKLAKNFSLGIETIM
jgi:hypothetical protein